MRLALLKVPHCSRAFGLHIVPGSMKHPDDVRIQEWPEHEGGRGTNEVASCVVRKLLTLPAKVEKVVLSSDNCPGQNRSQYNMLVPLSIAWIFRVRGVLH